jgi:carbon storage regulator
VLILSRKLDEKIMIGDRISITIIDIDKNKVKLGIEAPAELEIYREELYKEIEIENKEAAGKVEINLNDLMSLKSKKKQNK